MEKKPKLDLEPPDFSKAKLPLGDKKDILAKIVPQLPLGSEPVGAETIVSQAIQDLINQQFSHAEPAGIATAFQKIAQDIEKAYENPSLKAYMQAEEDRRALLQASIDKWNEPSLQTKMREYEELLKNPAYSVALEKPTSIQDYVAQIATSFDNKNYEAAKIALEAFNPQMNSAYSVAQSALEQIQKTIDSPSIQSYFSQLPNLEIYESGLAKAAASIANNEDLLGSSKILAEIGTSLASDSLNYKIAEQSKKFPGIIKTDYVPLKIPENPLPKQNAQMISILEILKEQNDTLITINSEFLNFERSDLDIQNSIILLMQNQQTSYEIMIEELKTQNNGIETQVIELKKQNTISAGQIEDNRKSSRQAMAVAIGSIIISIIVSVASILATYDVSAKEKIENNSDNVKLLEAIDNKTVENQKEDQLIKLMKEQNTYLKKLAERESK